MDHNTEEIMREDFARVVQLDKQIRAGAGPDIGHNVEYGRRMATAERNTFVKAWTAGPHASRWQVLHNAHARFATEPEPMVQLYADVYTGRDSHGMDPVDQRSVIQAVDLHGRDDQELRMALIAATADRSREGAEPRTPTERGRGPIERSR